MDEIIVSIPQLMALIISSLIVVIFIGFIIVRIIRHQRFARQHDWLDRKGLVVKWRAVEQLFDRTEDVSWKLAVLEADKLLDYTLKMMALPGQTLGERLKGGAYRYPNLPVAWDGHKIRNKLVHETGYHLSRGEAARARSSFAAALRAVGVL